MKKANELDLYIGALGAQINTLRKNADESEISAEIYNRLVVKKAILVKQTQKDDSNSFLNRLKRRVLNKAKLVCDYF
jgi:hypothetical protein